MEMLESLRFPDYLIKSVTIPSYPSSAPLNITLMCCISLDLTLCVSWSGHFCG